MAGFRIERDSLGEKDVEEVFDPFRMTKPRPIKKE